MTSWVDVELADLDLGDTRRDKRIKRMVTTMADTPAGHITKAFLTRDESEAAYRALSSEHTDVAAIRAAVRKACVSRIAGHPVVSPSRIPRSSTSRSIRRRRTSDRSAMASWRASCCTAPSP